MNIAMEQTEEYQNGVLKAKYGDAFIRGNNGTAPLFVGRCYMNLGLTRWALLLSSIHQLRGQQPVIRACSPTPVLIRRLDDRRIGGAGQCANPNAF